MQALEWAEDEQTDRNSGSSWRQLGGPFWRFFFVSLCFDIGFGLYFFLTYLYLAQLHLGERAIGLAAGALTAGNVVATLPVAFLARRLGLQKILLFCFVSAPLLAALRIVAVRLEPQIILAFMQGAVMSIYTVCFAPALASLTTERNRTTAFSITFGTGIGSGAIAGLLGGAAPEWLRHLRPSMDLSSGMACVLLLGCAIAVMGSIPLLRLVLPNPSEPQALRRRNVTTPFVMRFLAMVAVWNLSMGAFAPFATIYLAGPMHIALRHVGLIFSASQMLQVGGILAAPLVYRSTGKEKGIAILQAAASIALISLCLGHSLTAVVASYLFLTMFQYMCNPAIYSLLMDRTESHLRATASALQNIVSCSFAAIASAAAGILIAHFGYASLFAACAILSIAAAAVMLGTSAVKD